MNDSSNIESRQHGVIKGFVFQIGLIFFPDQQTATRASFNWVDIS